MHLHRPASLAGCDKCKKKKKEKAEQCRAPNTMLDNGSQLSDSNKATKSPFEIRAGAFDSLL